MEMNQWVAMSLVLLVFAIGDVLGVATKAKMSSVFVTLLTFLALFMFNVIPADIMTQAGLTAAARVSGSFVVFHMGSSINIRQLLEEWRTLLLAIIAMFVAAGSVILVAPIVGWNEAIVSIPIINGGIVATNIMVEAAVTKGAPMAAALGTLVYGVQKFVGTVPASRMGLIEAQLVVDEIRAKKAADPNYSWYAERDAKMLAKSGGKEKGVPFWKKVDKMWTPYTTLFVGALATLISNTLAGFTNGLISSSIWALLLGALGSELGIIPPKIMDRGRASGFFSMLIFVSIISSLASITLTDLFALSWQAFVVFGATLIGTFILLYVLPGWKIVGSKNLAVGIAMAQMLGYPATYLISQEIAKAAGQTDEEVDAVVARIETPFVLAGFATVTSFSIIMAGLLENLIR